MNFSENIIEKNQPTEDLDICEVNRITVTGLFVNLILCVFKVVAGVYGKSQALIADGIHTLSDSVTDIAVLVGAKFWAKGPDFRHPYGHRKVEAIVTMLIGLALVFVGGSLAYHAIVSLPQKHDTSPGGLAFFAALTSIIVKEWLYRWTIRTGKKVKSSALIANAWHHRSDAFSSIPVAVAVAVSYSMPEWSFLDHVATVAVALFIFKAALTILTEPLHDLLERGGDEKLVKEIEKISFSVSGVKGVHKIRSRSVSSVYFVDMHIEVDPNINISQGHNIATEVKNKLSKANIGIIDTLIHIEPYTEH